MSGLESELLLGVTPGPEGPLARKRSTGEYWARQNPELAARALVLWEETHNISAIASALGVGSRNTVQAFLEGRGMLKVEQSALKDRYLTAASLMVDRVIQEPERVPVAALAITAKLFTDGAMVLSGQPTQIVRHEVVTVAPEVTAGEIERYRRAGMGLGSGGGLSMGSGRPAGEVIDAEVVSGGEQPPI